MPHITGKVVDKETGQGVPFASVELRNANDQYLGYGIAADQFGIYDLDSYSIAPGTYLKATAVGYYSNSVPYETFMSNPNISISRNAPVLDEVIVTAPPAATKGTANKLLIGAAALGLLWWLFDNKKKR